jgi:hypothetical protein
MTTPSPSVPDFLAGFGLQQSDLQSLWVNAAAFFQQRVIFRATQTTTATTLPSSGAVTTIAYDNIIEDPYGGWSASTHKWTAPAGYSGWYQVTVTVWAATPGAINTVLSPFAGGSAAYNPNSGVPLAGVPIPNSPAGVEGSWYLWLTGGQDATWGAGAILNSGSNVLTNLTAGEQSSLEITWLGS